MAKHYLVDGSNLSRGADYDARFPEMEDVRAQELVERVSRLAERLGGRAEVEIYFDGPSRNVGAAGPALVRFSYERSADQLIEGKVRLLRSRGAGVVVATEDGSLGRELESEGARIIGRSELWRLCGG